MYERWAYIPFRIHHDLASALLCSFMLLASDTQSPGAPLWQGVYVKTQKCGPHRGGSWGGTVLGVQSQHVGSLTSLQLGDMLYAHCSHDVLQGLGAAVQAKKLFNEVSQMAWEGRASARCKAVVLVNAQMLCEYAWTCLDFTKFSASL